MDAFCEFVNRNALINVPISRSLFSWSNFQEQPSLSKLDKFLVSADWDDYYSPVSVHALLRVGSDHTPILLKRGEVLTRSGPTPFKFQNMWLLQPSFIDLVKGWWEDIVVEGPPE